jgi:hypothetical protein
MEDEGLFSVKALGAYRFSVPKRHDGKFFPTFYTDEASM